MTLGTISLRCSASPLSAAISSRSRGNGHDDPKGLQGKPRSMAQRASLYRVLVGFLVASLLARSYTTSSRQDDFLPTNAIIYDTIIVGAGWSGLSTASNLIQRGITNFVVLEGRETIGGRSRTVYPLKAHGLAVELGSAWLYEHTEPFEFALEMELPLGQVHYDDPRTQGFYDTQQGEVRGAARKHLKGLWKDYCQYSQERTEKLQQEGKDVPYAEILEAYLELHNTRHLGHEMALTTSERDFLLAMVHAQTEIEHAAPLTDVSAQTAGDQVNTCVFCDAEYYVPVQGGGFDKLLKPLAQPFLQNIQFQTKVTKVEYDIPLPGKRPSHAPELVTRVTYTNLQTGETQFKLAKTVLVTVPLGVLKHGTIKFVPPLPAAKQNAIDVVGFGILNKCILYWDTPQTEWWPTGREVLTRIDRDKNYTTIFNDRELGNGNHYVLTAWIAGESARTMELESNETIADHVYDHLVQMLSRHNDGEVVWIPRPTQVIVTRWGHDEFSYGSYSYNTVPDRRRGPLLMEGARRELGLRTGSTLFWAGEATHETWSGTTVGAYRSGQSAAENIRLALLRQQQHGKLRFPKKKRHHHHHKEMSYFQ